MSIFIGFDGGGSKSRFLIARGDNPPEMFLFSLNLKYTDLGIVNSAKGFAACLHEILGEEIPSLRAICISLSGASNGNMNEELAQEIRKKLSLPIKIHIESDSSFTLHTAYPDDESGLLLIAGTGSVAMAKERNGKMIKVGGWGRVLGDEGSGYWIGVQALKHYTRATDGLDHRGNLFTHVRNSLHETIGTDPSALRSKLYHNELKPQDLAPMVFEMLDHDEAAKNILDQSITHLMNGITVLWKKVKLNCDPVVTFHGSIARQKYIVDHIILQCKDLGMISKIMDEHKTLGRALKTAEYLL